jgi:hypothetical protein
LTRRNIIYSIIWFAGAMGLLYYSNLLLDFVHKKALLSYDMRITLWTNILIPIVSGLYLGLIFGLPKRLKLNVGRLIVFILSLVLLIYCVIPFYFNSAFLPEFMYLLSGHSLLFIGMINGFTLITGLFKFKDEI